MSKTQKPILIAFDSREFDAQSEKFKRYISLQSKAKKILSQLAPEMELPKDDEILNPLQLYYDFLESNPANLLKMKGQAIASAQGTDLKELINVDRDIKENKCKAPSINEYSRYATTPEEIEKFNAMVDLINAYKKLCQLDSNLKIGSLINSLTYARLNVDYEKNTIVPNPNYILNDSTNQLIYG